VDSIDPGRIKCVIFDYGYTLSPENYFKVSPPQTPQWHEIIQEHIFHDPAVVIPWMKGEITSLDVAHILSQYIPLDGSTILSTMEEGCRELAFNPAVWILALKQKLAGRQIALVTANMDVFTKVVVPAHKLDRIFDVIVNSADFHEIRKEFLWPIAFDQLDDGIGYTNSLLIEDGESEAVRFRQLGGLAYQYSTDKAFSKWTQSTDWSQSPYG